MLHRTRTVHEQMITVWMALTAATACVAVLVGQSQHDAALYPAAVGALAGGVAGALGTGEGRWPDAGTVLATEAQTRRAVWRRLRVFVPATAVIAVGAALLGVVWAAPAITLAGALGAAIAAAHLRRWERRHPELLVAQRLTWLGKEHRTRWLRAWGDRAPDDLTPETSGATLPPTWLEASGFWPSKNPDDYR